MFDKVLIANRGAIACRILRTLRRLQVRSIALYTTADAASLHVSQADEAYCIGDGPAAQSYLNAALILEIARDCGAQAVHPGYGFLSENAAFATACESAGIAFIGPTPQQMRDFGLKHTARRIAQANAVPLLPGSGLLADAAEAETAARHIAYPVMLKSTAGGGGIGMRLCRNAEELISAFGSVQRLAEKNFSDGGVFLEKYIEPARHIEVQLFGDGRGRVIALGERDCSLQRRNQKVVEETPAPNLTASARRELCTTAERLGVSVSYRSAGTVEFVLDANSEQFYFLEVNTRLQVEHGVTEAVTGIDIVEWMLKLAAHELPDLESLRPTPRGHSIQVRLYAEDPGRNFTPATGTLTEVVFPDGVRCDTGVETGSEITPYYDPMLAKIIAQADTRSTAIALLQSALAATRVGGLESNLDYLRQIVCDPVFMEGRQTTRYLDGLSYQAETIEVLEPGTQTTVQDYPGRVGYWDVGVPPSGPMDDLAFRLGNRLLGNRETAAGLEIAVSGPTLRFHTDAVIAITGATLATHMDGQAVPLWQAVLVPAGARVRLGRIEGPGARSYLCIRHGIEVPTYLGSRATFTLGRFGGHGGRALGVGDVLHIQTAPEVVAATLDPALIPSYSTRWELKVVYGPHGAPDFFTPADIERFFAADWEVHYNSSRTGVRLIGPKPEWARPDGGEAGLHPSNIHDNAYAIGTVDFTGDMPVILGPDGPSLGGFVCPATVIRAERWKLGQLRPGDRVRFLPVSIDTATQLYQAQTHALETLRPQPQPAPLYRSESPIIRTVSDREHEVGVTYRPSGDDYLLIEYGVPKLDIALRFRVHALMLHLKEQALPGILDLTPGIRSLQVHYDPRRLSLPKLMEVLGDAEATLTDIEDQTLPARIVHLPLAWDDTATRQAIERYQRSVRPDAPWCPSKIEFIRRINGLDTIEEVKRIVFDAHYLVMGLGDVYLGAPVATPLDPRHRLVTTKYNPARTWTPENAVGIGGSYLCVYGMEGPGGYQFVGRTVQMWNRYRRSADFTQPWLLRFFDQIHFFPVSEDNLMRMRADFPCGRYRLQIEETTFSLRPHREFLLDNVASIAEFKARQQTAFLAERTRWIADGQADYQAPTGSTTDAEGDAPLTDGEHPVNSPVSGNLFEITVNVGDRVEAGQVLAIIESMKMEITVTAPVAGSVSRVACKAGALINTGQRLLVIRPDS